MLPFIKVIKKSNTNYNLDSSLPYLLQEPRDFTQSLKKRYPLWSACGCSQCRVHFFQRQASLSANFDHGAVIFLVAIFRHPTHFSYVSNCLTLGQYLAGILPSLYYREPITSLPQIHSCQKAPFSTPRTYSLQNVSFGGEIQLHSSERLDLPKQRSI